MTASEYLQGTVSRSACFLALLFVFHSAACAAEKSSVSAGGSIRSFATITDFSGTTSAEALSLLRLKLSLDISASLSGEFAYELAPHIKEKGGSTILSLLPRPGLLSYRAFDLEEMLLNEPEDGFFVTQNLDRAFVTVTADSFDLSIGRQPVAFGSARVINPTDVIAPFTYTTIAKEELAGVDALRLRIPRGELGELDAGIVFGEDMKPDGSAAFLRLKSHVLGTDASLMAMVFRENLLFGADLARSIGGAGAWCEAAYALAEETPEEDYLRVSLGADYSFTGKLYGYLEYHFNGAGAGRPEDYFSVVTETAYSDGAVYLLGKHYVAPGLTYEATPLLLIIAQALINLQDGSALAFPLFEYSLADDVTVRLGAFIAMGHGAERPGTALLPVPHSEFGLYPDLYYAALNVYF